MSAFYKAAKGKIGDNFGHAIINFAMEATLEAPTQSILYRWDDGWILFITDNPLNDIGSAFFGIFDKISFSTVDSKKQVKAGIKRLSEPSKDSLPKLKSALTEI